MIKLVFLLLLYLLIFAFIIFNVATNFKFIRAIYMAIIDFIHSDKHIFKGYGVWLYVNLGGSGKTISIVNYLNQQHKKYPKLKIYTNFNYKYATGKITDWQDVLNLENDEVREIDYLEYENHLKNYDITDYFERNGKYYEKIHNGIIFGFDEIQLTFRSDKWQDAPDDLLSYISLQRKFHKQILGSTQSFERVDRKIREQTNFVIECSCFLKRLVFNRVFRSYDYLVGGDKKDAGQKKRKRTKRFSFIATDELRNCYDTNEIVATLNKKSSTQMFIDNLNRINSFNNAE